MNMAQYVYVCMGLKESMIEYGWRYGHQYRLSMSGLA